MIKSDVESARQRDSSNPAEALGTQVTHQYGKRVARQNSIDKVVMLFFRRKV